MNITMGNQQEIQSYIGGLFDAEGWQSDRKNNEKQYGFVNTNVVIMEYFTKYLEDIGCKYSMITRKRKKKYKTQYQICIDGKHTTKIFRDYTQSIKLNNFPKHYIWLLGFLDGDGSVSLTERNYKKLRIKYIPRIRFFNTNTKLVEQAENLLKEKNIPYHIYSSTTNRKKRKYTIEICGIKRCQNFIEKSIQYTCAKKGHLEILKKFIDSRLSKPKKTEYSNEEKLCSGRLKILNDYTLDA